MTVNLTLPLYSSIAHQFKPDKSVGKLGFLDLPLNRQFLLHKNPLDTCLAIELSQEN